MIGKDAEHIIFEEQLMVDGTVPDGRYSSQSTPDYFSGSIRKVPDDEFEKIYGRSLPQNSWNGDIHMNDAVCQLYYGKGVLGRLICFVLKNAISISKKRGVPSLNLLFNYNMPIRGYAKMTGGAVTMEMARALTEMANGHRIKGTGHLIKAAVKRN